MRCPKDRGAPRLSLVGAANVKQRMLSGVATKLSLHRKDQATIFTLDDLVGFQHRRQLRDVGHRTDRIPRLAGSVGERENDILAVLRAEWQ